MKKILALDIATKTGWKTVTTSGTWNFKIKSGETDGMKIIRFKSKVKEMILAEDINLVVYERAASQFRNSLIAESEMIGVLKLLIEELKSDRNIKVELACFSAKEIKKHATGNGNANKDAMVKKAIELGYKPCDDNEADAIHIYRMAESEFN